MMRTMVIGLGNRFRSDDAVGLIVAARFEARRGVTVVTHTGDMTGLCEMWRGADVAVVVDAMSSADPPGTVRRFDVQDAPLPRSAFRGSTHAFGIADAVDLARTMGTLPQRLIVYGVAGTGFDHGDTLSEPVARAVDALLDRIRADVEPVAPASAGAEAYARDRVGR